MNNSKEETPFKIVIWGTGFISQRVWEHISPKKVVGFIESVPDKKTFLGLPVYEPEWLKEKNVYVIVANDFSDQIHALSEEMGLDETFFIYLKSAKSRLGCKDMEVIRQVLGEAEYTFYCDEYKLYEDSYFSDDASKYSVLNRRPSFNYNADIKKPVIIDKYLDAGNTGLYFWQDLWAAKIIFNSGVKSHFDIGSRIDGFVAHLLAMGIEVNLIDIREFPDKVDNLHTICSDATTLDRIKDDSIDSISALCSLEHFGLGRYGDIIDPEACFKAFKAIGRVMKSGGNLFISVPVGKECIEFNAHRQFYASTVVNSFPNFILREFSTCLEHSIEYNIPVEKYDNEYVDGNYRFGLFWFTKK